MVGSSLVCLRLDNLHAIAFPEPLVGIGQRGERTKPDQGRVAEWTSDKLTLRGYQRDREARVSQA